MPSGKTHDRITLWLLPFLVISVYLTTKDSDITLLCACGFFLGGLIFGPDLDIRSIHYKRWGVLRFFWLPYQKVIPHRSWLSHGLIVGTLVRLCYLFFWFFMGAALLIAIAQLLFGFAWNWHDFVLRQARSLLSERRWATVTFLLGLELGAMSHYLSDFLLSSSPSNKKDRN